MAAQTNVKADTMGKRTIILLKCCMYITKSTSGLERYTVSDRIVFDLFQFGKVDNQSPVCAADTICNRTVLFS